MKIKLTSPDDVKWLQQAITTLAKKAQRSGALYSLFVPLDAQGRIDRQSPPSSILTIEISYKIGAPRANRRNLN